MIHLTNKIKFLRNNLFIYTQIISHLMALFSTKTRLLCQNAFLFKFVVSLGNKEILIIGKISLTIEATNSTLALVVK